MSNQFGPDPLQQPRNQPLTPQQPVDTSYQAPSLKNATPGLSPLTPLARVVASQTAYNKSYAAPLASTPNFAAGKLPQSVLDGIQRSLQSLQATHPAFQNPHPLSQALNGETDGRARQLLDPSQIHPGVVTYNVGKQLFDETLGKYFNLWHTDPGEALKDTLIGGAGIAGLALVNMIPGVGEAVDIGLLGLGAAHSLPPLFQAIADEVATPNDANTTKLLVNTAHAYMDIGTPTKALRGIKGARKILRNEVGLSQEAVSGADLARKVFMGQTNKEGLDALMVSGNTLRQRVMNPGIHPNLQMKEVPQGEELVNEVERLGLLTRGDLTEEEVQSVQNLMRVDGQKEMLLKQLQDLSPEEMQNPQLLNDKAKESVDTLQVLAHEEWMPARMDFAHRFQYLASNTEKTLTPILSDAERTLYNDLKLHRSHAGHLGRMKAVGSGWSGLTPGSGAPIEAMLEAKARAYAGPLQSVQREIQRYGLDLRQKMKLPEAAWEKALRAMEDPEVAKTLNPTEMLFAKMVQNSLGVMTNFRMRNGLMSLSDPNWTRKVLVYKNAAEGVGNPLQNAVQSLIKGGTIKHEHWDINIDQDAEHLNVIRKSPTRASYMDHQDTMDAKYEGVRPGRDLMATRGDEIRALRRNFGTQKAVVTKMTNRLNNKLLPRFDQLRTEVQSHQTELDMLDFLRQGLRNKRDAASNGVRKGIVDQQTELNKLWKSAGRELASVHRAIQGVQPRIEELTKALSTKEAELLKQEGSTFHGLVTAESDAVKGIIDSRPGSKTLLSGDDWWRYVSSEFVNDMHKTGYYDDLLSLANTSINVLHEHLPGSKEKYLGHDVMKMKPSDQPAVLPAHAFETPAEAEAAGYRQMMGGIGNKDELNYRPALYGRQDIVDPWLDAMKKARDLNDMNGAFKALHNVSVSLPKRLIFVSPAWHFVNVAGRALTQMLNDPATTGSALFSLVQKRMSDPESYEFLRGQFHLAGGVPAYRFQVSQHIQHLMQESHGQTGWLGTIRTGAGKLTHPYEKYVEEGFWKMVDDVGLTAFATHEARLRAKFPDLHPDVARTAAAEYANQISGMVNPLYMNRWWRHTRDLATFAPSYWATMMRSVESSIMTKVPGGTRLGHFAASHGMEGATPVRLRALEHKVWRETVRAQSSWFTTYMATALVFGDMMNMIGSDKHVWENEKGRTFDINLSNLMPPGLDQYGTKKEAYVSGNILFRQAADVGNALGLGHQWGLAHELTDENFKQASIEQKAQLALGALWDGVRRTGAGKVSTALSAGVIGLMGQDPKELLATGTKVDVPNAEAFTALIPSGSSVRTALRDYQQAAKDGGHPFDAKTEATTIGQSLVGQLTGSPSIYWMGDEKAQTIPTEKMTNYLQTRDDLQKQAVTDSGLAESGQISLLKWQQDRQKRITQQLQLDKDTFGSDTPAGQLSSARYDLLKKYGLNNDTSMTTDTYFQKLDQFEADWQKTLENSSPEANALWWDHVHKNWTNMDYLYWYTRQMKQSIMGQIDGANGERIRAAQNKLGPLLDVPGIDRSPSGSLATAEAAFPEYVAYKQIMKQIGHGSALGAMIAAFTSPFSQTTLERSDLTPEQNAALYNMLGSGATFVTQSKLKQAEADATKEGNNPAVAAAGGRASADPAFQASMGQAVKGAESNPDVLQGIADQLAVAGQ